MSPSFDNSSVSEDSLEGAQSPSCELCGSHSESPLCCTAVILLLGKTKTAPGINAAPSHVFGLEGRPEVQRKHPVCFGLEHGL